MKPGNCPTEREQIFKTKWIALLVLALLAAGVPFAEARPRPPLPPCPELAPLLLRAAFDEPYGSQGIDPRSFHPAYGDLVDGWSGYALRRSGAGTIPFLVPALNATGHTNIAGGEAAVRFWFRPCWTSASLPGGAGPGLDARLIELSAVTDTHTAVVWSFAASPDGATLSLVTAGAAGYSESLKATIAWEADQWHLVALNYGPKGSVLFLDGQLVAEGGGVTTVTPDAAVLSIGSTVTGSDAAEGEFDEVCAFARPLSAAAVALVYQLAAPTAARGAITPDEEEAMRAAAAKWRTEHDPGSGTPLRMMQTLTGCDTNGPIRLTNVVCAYTSNSARTVTFDVIGGTNVVWCDVFTTTNLFGTNIAAAQWTWLERGRTCSTYLYTNQPGANASYIVGTPQDSDGDGFSDAIELLVGKTDPLLGVNRIQTENAITGTTNWQLTRPIGFQYNTATNTPNWNFYYRSWPTSDTNSTPEIEGFASTTSANLGESIDFYVDLRDTNNFSNFTMEIFRLGWYSGAGGRQMTWSDDGNLTNAVVLPGRRQRVPQMNPTNGLIDCLSGWTPNGTDTNLIWQRSYTLAIPSNWVSGVYVARITAGPNTVTNATGRQNQIVFVVRDDARSSEFLFQCSTTTWQAYNSWGGSSLYGLIPPDSPQLSTVSFNRPYGLYFGSFVSDTNGVGAGHFFADHIGLHAWEYNMVRWLERQGYDVTYCTSLDTHRSWPASKVIKTWLSVGHDEYWSQEMRTHVESARDRGINLGFFSANTCYWRLHLTPDERAFSVDKVNELDLWRGMNIGNHEMSLIGVEFAGFPVLENMKLPATLPTGTGVNGLHWAYDHSGLTNGSVMPGLLGYEVDGWWSNPNCCAEGEMAPSTNTIKLADSVFRICEVDTPCSQSSTGHSYMTIYTAANGAEVFATGTIQWSWGLDEFRSQFALLGGSRLHPAAQQLTHNVLRKFSNKETASILLTNVDAITSGNWTGFYGLTGYVIAASSPLSNLPAYAQITISNQHNQVWEDPSTNTIALLKPGSSNRIASAWTTTNSQNASFTIDINLTNANTHQVALYCADWIGTGPVLQKIEVFEPGDSLFAHPLDTRSFQLPANGVYLVWQLSGRKILRVTKPDAAAGTRAMVSAIFISD